MSQLPTALPLVPASAVAPVPGSVAGTFGVSPTGSATYRIPLNVPPGRAGMAPALSINYDSSDAESTLGVGASLGGLSAIEHCPKNYARDATIRGVKYDVQDPLCLDGLRLVPVGTTTTGVEYRTIPDTHVRVIAHVDKGWDTSRGPTWFEVFDKNHEVRTLGGRDDARVRVSHDHVASWWLTERRDRWNNAVQYFYKNEQNEQGAPHTYRFYLDRIEYTSHPTQLATRRIDFAYDSWAYHGSSFHDGVEIRRDRRLREIKMSVVDRTTTTLVRRYTMTYKQSVTTGRAQLETVRECDATMCKPPTVLRWLDPGSELTSATPIFQLPGFATMANLVAADVTGDGLEDLVFERQGSYISVAANTGNGYAAPVDWSDERLDNVAVLDYDQDGRADLLEVMRAFSSIPPVGASAADLAKPRVHRATETGTFTLREPPLAPETFALSWTNVESCDKGGQVGDTLSEHVGIQRHHLADVNGDGISDFVACYLVTTCVTDASCDHPAGSGCADTASWSVAFGTPSGFLAKQPILPGVDTCTRDIKFVDLDADRKVDILLGPAKWLTPECVGCTYQMYSFDPADRPQQSGQTTMPGTWVTRDSGLPVADRFERSTAFLDVNGDGLVDAIQPVGTELVTRINLGTGFAPPISTLTNLSPAWYDLNNQLDDSVPIDYDADGTTDLMIRLPCGLGSCWYLLRSSQYGDGTMTATQLPYPGTMDLLVTDADGDGRHDVIVFDHNDATLYRNKGRTDLVASITDGMNPLDAGDPGFLPTVEIAYTNLVDRRRLEGFAHGSAAEEQAVYVADWTYDPSLCGYPRACIAGATTVVNTYKKNTGNNLLRPFQMRYRNGRTDRLYGGLLGFSATMTNDVLSRATHVTLADVDIYDAALHAYPFAGLAWRTLDWKPPLFTQPDSELLLDVTETQRVVRNVGPTYFAIATNEHAWKHEAPWNDSVPTDLAQVDSAIFANHHLVYETVHERTDVDDYGNIKAESTDVVGHDRTSVTRVFKAPNAWLVNLPELEVTCSKAAGEEQCRAAISTFDWRGELQSKIVHSPGDLSTELTTSFTFDVLGNITSTATVDHAGDYRSACSTFDADGLYVVAERNALGHTSYTRASPLFGTPAVVRDTDGRVTKYELDTFGRTVRELRPDGTETRTTVTRVKDGGPSATWWNLKERTEVTGGADTTVTYDMLGRTVASETKGPSVEACHLQNCTSTPRYRTVFEYDLLGHLERESRPYLTAVPSSKVYSQYQYDAAGRRIQSITPWGETTTITYDGLTTTRHDSAGDEITDSDPAGRAVRIVDRKGTETTQVFGPFGGRRTVTSAGEVTTWMTDAFGRIRTFGDPNRGTTTYEYNGHGEQRFAHDALGRTIETRYDALGRKTKRIDGTQTTGWFYGAPNCVGCLEHTEAPDGGPVRTFTYDTLGRRVTAALTVAGETYKQTIDYDGQSRPWKLHYPSAGGVIGPVIELQTDFTGFVYGVRDFGIGTPYWKAKRLDASGRVTMQDLGNGLSIFRQNFLEKGTAQRIKTIKTGNSNDVRHDLEYDYDQRLNPTMRRDHVGNQVEYFVYDELDRLTCQTWSIEDPDCVLRLTYKPNGNIESKSDIGGGVYKYEDALHPHAATYAGGSLFTYDAVGNQTHRPGATIEYTPFDLPTKYVLDGQGEIRFEYDADEARVHKIAPGYDKVYLDDAYERRKQGATDEHRFYLPAGDGRVVLTKIANQAVQTTYLHVDALGTADLITSATGAIVQRRSTGPFGERRALDWDQAPIGPFPFLVTDDGFTGHEQDDEVGLINMRGRIYEPRVGRFLQVDPVNTDPAFSQRWNAYSYVLNNPLRYTDPTGRDGGETESTAEMSYADPSQEQSYSSTASFDNAANIAAVAPVAAGSAPIGDQAAPPPTAAASQEWGIDVAFDPSFGDIFPYRQKPAITSVGTAAAYVRDSVYNASSLVLNSGGRSAWLVNVTVEGAIRKGAEMLEPIGVTCNDADTMIALKDIPMPVWAGGEIRGLTMAGPGIIAEAKATAAAIRAESAESKVLRVEQVIPTSAYRADMRRVSSSFLSKVERGELPWRPYQYQLGHKPGAEHAPAVGFAREIGMPPDQFKRYTKSRPENFFWQSRASNERHATDVGFVADDIKQDMIDFKIIDDLER